MGKFCQVNSELLPLICVENWFQCTILAIYVLFSSNFVHVYELILGRSGLGS